MPTTTPIHRCPICGATLDHAGSECATCRTTLDAEAAHRRDPRALGTFALPAALTDSQDDLHLVQALRAALEPTYLLVRQLGRGGMGRVYLARDPQLKRFVAVKVLAPEFSRDAESRERFAREAQAVAAISHPNVVNIYGVGELADGTPYFVMEYVAGRSISERLTETGPMPVDEARRVLGEVAAALAVAHRRGIIHRDIKPANILQDVETGRALVTDFGIASNYAPDPRNSSARITEAGATVGTPAYMSPEQVLAEQVTAATDVYALGLLGYELLTARGPYNISSPREILAAHLRDAPAPLHTLRPDAPADLGLLLEKCLIKKAENRPTAAEIAEQLSATNTEPIEWPPPGLEQSQGALDDALRRLRIGVLALVGPPAALIAFGVWRASSVAPVAGVAFATSVVGAALVVMALVRIIGIRHRGRRAIPVGYRFVTLLEVFGDRRRDGGELLLGRGRYAGLTPAMRSRLRALRVIRLGLLAVSALWPLAAVLPALPSASGNAAGYLVAVFGPSFLCALLEGGARFYERQRTLSRPRGDRSRPIVDALTAQLVAPWYVTFERARQGQGLGSGWPYGELLYRIIMVVLVATVLWVPVVIGFAWTTPTVSTYYTTPVPTDIGVTEAEAARPYRAAVDAAIGPAEAGQLIYDLAWAGSPWSGDRHERRPSQELPPVPRAKSIAGGVPMFGLSGGVPANPAPTDLITAAFRGLTPDEQLFVREYASSPALPLLRRLGHAATADVSTAMFDIDSLRDASWGFVAGFHPRGMTHADYVLAAAAAHEVAAGRRDTAEAMLREALGLGFLLMEQPSPLSARTGVAQITRARDALATLYLHASPSEAVRLERATLLALRAGTWKLRASDGTHPQTDALADTSTPQPFRWEFARHVREERCSNLHTLVFGSTTIDRKISEARETLPRSAAERALFDALVMPSVPIKKFAWWAESNPLRLALRTTDHIAGGTRFEGCLIGQ